MARVEGLSSLPHKRPCRASVKVLAFQHLASPRVSNQKESKMEAMMSFLTWKSCMAVSAILLCCGSTGQRYSYGRGPYKSVNSRRHGSLGAFLENDCSSSGPPKIRISLTCRTKYTHSSQTPPRAPTHISHPSAEANSLCRRLRIYLFKQILEMLEVY